MYLAAGVVGGSGSRTRFGKPSADLQVRVAVPGHPRFESNRRRAIVRSTLANYRGTTMTIRDTLPIIGLFLFAGCGGGSSSPPGPPPPPPPPPPSATTTISYDLADFDAVFVNGSYEISVQRGDNFRVEITIDTSEAGKLDVGQIGDVLRVDFLRGSDVRADTLNAVIEMPSLNSIELHGSNNAFVSGFDTNLMEMIVDGDNVITCSDGNYEYLMATVSGSSLIELANIAPVPGAHFEVSGSSTATVNLLDFASVTGLLAGSANLMYYGTDVNFEMNVAPAAAITRLGSSL